MSNPNPYAIRLELLKMAKDLLSETFVYSQERALREWEMEKEKHLFFLKEGSLKDQEENPFPVVKFPDYPTETEIVKIAEKLNKFISSKASKPPTEG